MSLILVATVGGLLLELRSWCSPERRVGVRRGGARDTSGHGERAAPVVYDRPLCQMEDPRLPAPRKLGAGPWLGPGLGTAFSPPTVAMTRGAPPATGTSVRSPHAPSPPSPT